MTLAPAALAEALRERYTLERELGRGGMAIVFLAHDLRHDRPVALKVLHAELVPTLGPDRFQREIRVSARLQHPHILTVLDSGEAAGLLWFTMPFVEGETLRDRLRREGSLPLEDALRIGREVADGLEYAHQHGVIHRDIKPENILLSAGHALIADFGIARALSGGPADGRTGGQEAAALTGTGLIVGTPAYMSPEQISGERDLGPRTDLYSLAAVVYEMLAGAPPFTGPTAQSVMAKHFSGEIPSLRQARPGVPEAVEAAIVKALAPEPEDRFATTAELGRALEGSGAFAAPAVRLDGRRSPILRRALTALAILLALLAAVAWWWTGQRGDDGPRRVAVLPFENVGAAEDEYFADGVADAVRGKLSGLSGLQVIASSSSDQYRATNKSPQEIGRELGADYLLVGKVRWNKAAGGASRVQVSPELIDAASATTRWQQPFDAPLADVFQVQGDIASRVADALDVAIGAGARERLASRPTQHMGAYDAFLRGERISHRVGVSDPDILRRAVAAYEEAVALDSSFALAWARLSRARSALYVNGPRAPDEAEAARIGAERAIALGPDLPHAYFARAYYLSAVRREHAQALEEVARGRRLAPRDAELLSMAGLAEQQLGRWDEAIAHFREAQSLDPRSLATARRLARALIWLRRYPEAREASEYALRLSGASPDVFDIRVASFVGQGDLAGAQAALRQAPAELERTHRLSHLSWYFNLFWLLDDAEQRIVLGSTLSGFDNDPGAWAMTLAQIYEVRGNAAAARAYADTARIALERNAAASPEDGVTRGNLALVLAMLGRRADAVREGELAMRLEPVATNGMTGPLILHALVLADIALGDQNAALDRLELLLRTPYYLSAAWVRLDPAFAALRGNPRFKALVGGRP